MQFLKTVVSRILKADQKLFEEKERKIKELLLFNLQLESERQKWKDEIEKIKALRDMEGVEAAMVSAELAQVNR